MNWVGADKGKRAPACFSFMQYEEDQKHELLARLAVYLIIRIAFLALGGGIIWLLLTLFGQ